MKNREKPSVTVDMALFTVEDGELKTILIQRNVEPAKGEWTIPGGFVHIEEPLEDAVKRVLLDKAGVDDVYLEQLYTFGDPKRDTRFRVITVAYFALISPKKLSVSSPAVSAAQWFPVRKLPKLAFDHQEILDYALKRLKWKLEYTTVAFSLLPKKFVLSEVQSIYETVFNKKFDKRNFTKKLISLNILKEEGIKKNVSHRPPMTYSLKKKIGEIIKII